MRKSRANRGQPGGTTPDGASRAATADAAALRSTACPSPHERNWPALAGLVLLAVLAFLPALTGPGNHVLSRGDGDLATQFIHWRRFGFGELARGNLALWNPGAFAGIPFFGGFQSALLYPPNLLFVVFPVELALDLSLSLHLLATGLAMFAWARARGLSPLAAFLSGATLMFSGPVFLHVVPGHVSNLCAMPWFPLLFLCVDRVAQRGRTAWMLAGMAVTAMLLTAGHPQYVFHAAVAATLLSACWLVAALDRPRTLLRLAAMAAGGLALAAVQVLVGLQETPWTVRSGGLWYEYAGMFSFPPENVLTGLVPDFFGSLADDSYWGRCLLWEMSLHFGVCGALLALFGAWRGERRTVRFAAPLAVVLFVLALGRYTPLYRVLFELVPGFAMFRGMSKFTCPMAVFVALLVGAGLQKLRDGERPPRKMLVGSIALAASLFVSALGLALADADPAMAGWWPRLMRASVESGLATNEASQPLQAVQSAAFVEAAARRAAKGLLQSALLVAFFVLAASGCGRTRLALPALGLVALVELGLFVLPERPVHDPSVGPAQLVAHTLKSDPGDYRILFLESGNAAMSLGTGDLWGHDPGTLRRYAEFLAFTQGLPFEEASQYLTFRRGHPLLALLRLRYVFRPDGRVLWKASDPPLPRARLVSRFTLAQGREAVFRALADPGFDAAGSVVLESLPRPLPSEQGTSGTVRVADESTDTLTLEAELPAPAILVLSDSYHPAWRARALPGSVQSAYEVLPADYVLRAVPLLAGRHRLRLEYAPSAYAPGLAISLIALACWLAACVRVGWLAWRGLRPSPDLVSR